MPNSKSRISIPRSSNPDPDNYSLIPHSNSHTHTHTPTPFSHSSTTASPFKPFKSPSMRNKARLHLALYALPRYPDTYHYALLTRPKDIASTQALSGVLTANKYHVKTTIRTNADGVVSHPWIYESYHIHHLADESLLLASLVIGKVSVSQDRITDLLRAVPIYHDDGSSDPGATKYNDVEWVRLAIEALRRADAVSDDGMTWEAVLEGSLNYMRRKQAEGRWQVGWKGGNPAAVATYDLLKGKDILF